MTPIILLHVNYVEGLIDIDAMCNRAVRWGYDGIEFRRRRAGITETPEEYLTAIREAREKYGMKQVSFGMPGPNLLLEDPAEVEREIIEYEQFLRLAKQEFNLDLVNATSGPLLNKAAVDHSVGDFHGSSIAEERHWNAQVSGLKRIARTAEALGIRIALEMHHCYLHDLPDAALRIVREVGSSSLGVNLDYGNMLNFRTPPTLENSITQLNDAIYLVHLKNAVVIGSSPLRCALAEGQIDNRKQLRLLHAIGYKGPICLEAPRPGDREWFAQEDIRYLRGLISDIYEDAAFEHNHEKSS